MKPWRATLALVTVGTALTASVAQSKAPIKHFAPVPVSMSQLASGSSILAILVGKDGPGDWKWSFDLSLERDGPRLLYQLSGAPFLQNSSSPGGEILSRDDLYDLGKENLAKIVGQVGTFCTISAELYDASGFVRATVPLPLHEMVSSGGEETSLSATGEIRLSAQDESAVLQGAWSLSWTCE